jgi:hypothetical protein
VTNPVRKPGGGPRVDSLGDLSVAGQADVIRRMHRRWFTSRVVDGRTPDAVSTQQYSKPIFAHSVPGSTAQRQRRQLSLMGLCFNGSG